MADRTILHSDINCCYAAIEHLYHPELKGKPIAVGGDPESRHGIILTADYDAKKFGIKVGMALWQAKQLCPELVILSPRMELYLRFSKMAREIYSEYTDLIEPFGIDESWLDVSASTGLFGDGKTIAEEISKRIKYELGITVSIGVSFNKIFAKLGSDYKKPDAITTMYREEVKNKIWPLPVKDLLYVGRSTHHKLFTMGIHTIGDLAQLQEQFLEKSFGKLGSILWAFANGFDDSPVCLEGTKAPIKSVGNSTTTPRDLENNEDVHIVLTLLSESVGIRLREGGYRCQIVEISIRDSDLNTVTRQRKLYNSTNITKELSEEAYQLFLENYDWHKPIRSIGVRGCELVEDTFWEQIDLFTDASHREKQRKIDVAMDEIRKRFGFFSIQRGLMFQDRILSSLNAKEERESHVG